MFTPEANTPHSEKLETLCATLRDLSTETVRIGPWQSGGFAELAKSGSLAGFLPSDIGGTGGAELAKLLFLTAIAESCLTTALAVSQWAAACRIINVADNDIRTRWLPDIIDGRSLTTIGISQLTTSRQHLGKKVLVAHEDANGWQLNGVCPWVTGADSVDTIVTGAMTDHGQRFFVIETSTPGLFVEPPMQMLALSGSRTSLVRLNGVKATSVITPMDGAGARTGGLSTTALALGAANASIAIIQNESIKRSELRSIAEQLSSEVLGLIERLHVAATMGLEKDDQDQLRADANGVVVRAAQAALVACKGAGFVHGHLAEQVVRESMFFLVWSCPQAVAHAVMCDLVGNIE